MRKTKTVAAYNPYLYCKARFRKGGSKKGSVPKAIIEAEGSCTWEPYIHGKKGQNVMGNLDKIEVNKKKKKKAPKNTNEKENVATR